MTFFNDPVLQPDHAARAIGMAVAMRERFATLSDDWRRRGHVLEIGIGIATGYATLGRIGFEGRYDYGAVGNAIILAARLSGEAAPGEILVAQRTYRRGRRRRRRGAGRRADSSRASAGRCPTYRGHRGRVGAERRHDVTARPDRRLRPPARDHRRRPRRSSTSSSTRTSTTPTAQLEAMRAAAAAGDADASSGRRTRSSRAARTSARWRSPSLLARSRPTRGGRGAGRRRARVRERRRRARRGPRSALLARARRPLTRSARPAGDLAQAPATSGMAGRLGEIGRRRAIVGRRAPPDRRRPTGTARPARRRRAGRPRGAACNPPCWVAFTSAPAASSTRQTSMWRPAAARGAAGSRTAFVV